MVLLHKRKKYTEYNYKSKTLLVGDVFALRQKLLNSGKSKTLPKVGVLGVIEMERIKYTGNSKTFPIGALAS